VGLSKIFHPGEKASGNDDPPSWTDPYWHPPNLAHWSTEDVSWRAVDPATRKEKPLPDEQTAQKALEVRYIEGKREIEGERWKSLDPETRMEQRLPDEQTVQKALGVRRGEIELYREREGDRERIIVFYI
jgi:hypothetical protein